MKVELSGFKGLEEALVELESITGKTTAGKAALRRAAIKTEKPKASASGVHTTRAGGNDGWGPIIWGDQGHRRPSTSSGLTGT
ncbi:hypothetical protein [Parasphingorhabdus sp.]|uniref:hypothetical protein n=1 Tax=Parasphingorhabdus sp. TaxID=2709688 RepID=UPI002F9294EF